MAYPNEQVNDPIWYTSTTYENGSYWWYCGNITAVYSGHIVDVHVIPIDPEEKPFDVEHVPHATNAGTTANTWTSVGQGIDPAAKGGH